MFLTIYIQCEVFRLREDEGLSDYAGTTNLAYHAKKFHSNLQQVKNWIAHKGKKDEKYWEARTYQSSVLIQVCLGMIVMAYFRL